METWLWVAMILLAFAAPLVGVYLVLHAIIKGALSRRKPDPKPHLPRDPDPLTLSMDVSKPTCRMCGHPECRQR